MVISKLKLPLVDILDCYFGSSLFWIAWCWIKSEWQLVKSNQRIWFLQECKRNRVVPKFISNRIQTTGYFHKDDKRAANARNRYALQVLSSIIRTEFKKQRSVRKEAFFNQELMFRYNKDDYLFVKDLKERATGREKRDSRRRLTRKLLNLMSQELVPGRTNKSTAVDVTGKERVTCIDHTITEAERHLLQKGPKFVPTKGRLTENERRALESEIEATACDLRRRWKRNQADYGNEDRVVSEIGPGRKILQDPKLAKLRHHGAFVTQPEKADFDTESRIRHLKAGLLNAYQNYQPRRRNITREETTAIKTLREQDIVVKCSDKSKSLVVISDEIYRQKVMKILGDAENYEESDVTAKTLEERVTKELMKIKTLKQSLPTDMSKACSQKIQDCQNFTDYQRYINQVLRCDR